MKNSFVVKCIAIILFATFMTTLLLSGSCVIFGIGSEAFMSSEKEQVEYREEFIESFLYNYNWRISEQYENYVQFGLKDGDNYNAYAPHFSDNILYEIKNENGNIVYSNIDDSAGNYKVSTKSDFYMLKDEYRNEDVTKETYEEVETGAPVEDEGTSAPVEESTTLISSIDAEKLSTTVEGPFDYNADPSTREFYDDKSYETTISYKAVPVEKDYIYYMGQFYDLLTKHESNLYIATVVSAVLSFVFFIVLLRVAGHTKKSDDIFVSKFDKIPADILTVIYVGLTFLLAFACIQLYEYTDDWWYYYRTLFEMVPFLIVLCIFGVFVDFSLLAILLMTFSVRFKTSTFIKSTIIYKLIVLIWKVLKKVWKGFVNLNKNIWKVLRKIPMVWKTVISIIAIVFFEFAIYIITIDWFPPLILFFNVMLCIAIIVVAILLKDIKKGTEEIANGNVYNKIDTKHLFLDLKDHAENINNISDGIRKAVADQMKSERFKTELITNVSHDIKTPLTSIINYVDLLEKEEINNETAKEYIDVLSRQSSRLKKLIDDLLEASKVSTGNIKVTLMKFEMGILLSQAIGEYEERFEKNNLQIVLNKSDEMLFVMADNRHMWRVFDNILNNIAKYAQQGTRVYIDAKQNGKNAEISFRNISKDPLNISGDELMERFVRGDSSRNTEGSGLGLSIAKSLTEVQKGKLDIQIDGDLFKVCLTFPLSE